MAFSAPGPPWVMTTPNVFLGDGLDQVVGRKASDPLDAFRFQDVRYGLQCVHAVSRTPCLRMVAERNGAQNIGPRFAAPPSMVMIVPVVYAEMSDARKATIAPISSAVPARPMGSGFINSSQRPSSPRLSLARPFMMVIRRSVAIAPGLMPTTRRPSSPAEPPSALVNAIRAALPVEPAI